MTQQIGLSAALVGMSLIAGTAQAAYVVSGGQYFNWTAANGTALTTTPATDNTRFTTQISSATATVSQEVVGGQQAVRLVDNNASGWSGFYRSYSTDIPTDFDYVVNLSFNIQSANHSGNGGVNDITIAYERGTDAKDTWRLQATHYAADPTKWSFFLDFGQGAGGNPIRGWNTFSYDKWYDVSIHRTGATTYEWAVVDVATGQVWNQTVVSTSFSTALPQANDSLRIGTGTYNNTTTMDIAFGKVSVGEVPEPASLSLLALGGLMIAARRR